MVQTLGTNSINDIYIGNDGNIAVFRDLQAVLGACETASKAQLGEMVLAINSGIPNFQTVWVGSPNFAVFQSYLRNTLLAIPGVIGVESIEISSIENTLEYTATINTQFGTGVIANG
jgi:hypothetical protein